MLRAKRLSAPLIVLIASVGPFSILAAEPEALAAVAVGEPVLDLAASASGKYIAFGGRAGVLGVMSADGKVIWTSEGYNQGLAADGSRPPLTGIGLNARGTVLWTTHEPPKNALVAGYDEDASITGIGFLSTPNGEVVVAGSTDCTLRFFKADDGTFLFQIGRAHV